MRISLALFIILWSTSLVRSQNYYFINFDGNDSLPWFYSYSLYKDTISNPNNIWQIGAPQKVNFTSAKSLPNAIVTDTVNTYPVNDTSTFILEHRVDLGAFMPCFFELRGWYSVDSDTLTDYGLIELSADGGASWINLLENDYVYALNNPVNVSTLPWPVLTGNSTGWKNFQIELQGLLQELDLMDNLTINESDVFFRFSFISDGIQTNKDGLMFDSLYVIDVPPINLEKRNLEVLMVYPNPSQNHFMLTHSNGLPAFFDLQLFDSSGKRIKSYENASSSDKFDCSELARGRYLLLIRTADSVLQGSFMKE